MIELRGFLTNLGKYNEGELVGVWVTFPLNEDEEAEAMEKIGIDGEEYEEYFFSDWECDVEGVSKNFGEYENINGINEIIETIEDIDEDLLSAALELDGFTIGIIEVAENIDGYSLFPDIKNDEDLGYYYADDVMCVDIPENIKPYFNYEAYGYDIRLEAYGTHTVWGWIECSN